MAGRLGKVEVFRRVRDKDWSKCRWKKEMEKYVGEKDIRTRHSDHLSLAVVTL